MINVRVYFVSLRFFSCLEMYCIFLILFLVDIGICFEVEKGKGTFIREKLSEFFLGSYIENQKSLEFFFYLLYCILYYDITLGDLIKFISKGFRVNVDCSIFFFFEIIFPIIIKSVKSVNFIILLKIRDQFAFKFLNCKILT